MIPNHNDPIINVPDLYITAKDAREQSIKNAEIIVNEKRDYKRKFLFENIHEAIRAGQTELLWYERPNDELLTELKDKGFFVSEIEEIGVPNAVCIAYPKYLISWE